MHLLRRAEQLAAERMGDHDLVRDLNRVHGTSWRQEVSSAPG
jgi:hypothetical protein